MSQADSPGKLNDPSFWDGNADYRDIVNDFTAFYSEKAWMLADLPQEAHVLDIAAGSGALTKFVAASGNRVLATDFSQGMVQSIVELGLPGVEARVMNGQALDLPDNNFDAAFSMFGIMLFEDWNRGLSEMVRVLKPDGLACIGTWKEPSGAAANLLLATISEWKFPDLDIPETVPGMVEWTDRDRFEAALSRAGLVTLRFHEVTSDFRITREMLAQPDRLFQFSPIWPLLDESQKAELLAELDELAARNGDVIAVASPAIIAMGNKQAG
mgnify:CR=1 FL=1